MQSAKNHKILGLVLLIPGYLFFGGLIFVAGFVIGYLRYGFFIGALAGAGIGYFMSTASLFGQIANFFTAGGFALGSALFGAIYAIMGVALARFYKGKKIL